MFKLSSLLFTLLLIHIFSDPTCKIGQNHCQKCHQISNLCIKCDMEVFTPNYEGGCSPSKTCKPNEQYCITCKDDSLCSECPKGYYPDLNGGCSYSTNCAISYNGECLECEESYVLIGKESPLKFCKYKYSEELLNCAEYSNYNGKCLKCEDGYYLSSDDKKCIDVENCLNSKFGICQECETDYYLDKRDDKCKKIENNILNNCKISLDGTSCDECRNLYYLSQDRKCVLTNYCSEVDENNECTTCIENYYLSEYNRVCTKEKLCTFADRDTGICNRCLYGHYVDNHDGFCKSNQENDKYKYCIEAYDDCLACDREYYLGTDNKCSNSKYCSKSENGTCYDCIENFHLGDDNKCTNENHCVRTNSYEECIECEDGYYFNLEELKCKEEIENLTNCLRSLNGSVCYECRKNYYFNNSDQLCYSNMEDNKFYKCNKINDNEECLSCEDDYFLNSVDKLCSKIEGCGIQENIEKCKECAEYFCLDVTSGKCVDNDYWPEKENEKKYFQCKKTNKNGNECEECVEGRELINGLCYNKDDCEEEDEDGNCLSCKDLALSQYVTCLNHDFGCVYVGYYRCLRCDDSLDLSTCTECKPGYYLDEDNYCMENNE